MELWPTTWSWTGSATESPKEDAMEDEMNEVEVAQVLVLQKGRSGTESDQIAKIQT